MFGVTCKAVKRSKVVKSPRDAKDLTISFNDLIAGVKNDLRHELLNQRQYKSNFN